MGAGRVVGIFIAREPAGPMVALAEAKAVAGKGLEGDRYFAGRGTWSWWPGGGTDVTLVEAEALEAISHQEAMEVLPQDTRRNLLTQGVRLPELVGRTFRVGEVLLFGVRPCEPCRHVARLAGKPLLGPLRQRGGLRADVLRGGTIRVGDPILAVPEES